MVQSHPAPQTSHERLSFISKLLSGEQVSHFIFMLGFLVRLIARLVQGTNNFWETGYHAYSRLVTNIVSHADFSVATNYGDQRSFWPPVYPLFLAVFTVGNRWYLPAI